MLEFLKGFLIFILYFIACCIVVYLFGRIMMRAGIDTIEEYLMKEYRKFKKEKHE